tara:strand:- start:7058 stop:7879 length:822 start_codon:yes stop_codon:yes gene_type:complete
MKISVVTISFNQAKFLERAIESIISQVDANFEYIIVDSGSTDGSREIIEKYRDFCAHIVFEKDRGPADGLNKGLNLASGELFYFLNSDDEVRPGAFAEAISLFKADPNLDVLYGNGLAIDENENFLRNIYSSQFFRTKFYALGLAVIVQQAAFIKIEALRAIGGFNVENRTSWDGEAFFQIAKNAGKFRRVWRNWGIFRIYPASISGGGLFVDKANLDHLRITGVSLSKDRIGLESIRNRLWWIALRMIDWRRWRSYLQGPFRPATAISNKKN